jgi:hypothetical protein
MKDMCVSTGWVNRRGGGGGGGRKIADSWYSQEHDDQLFLTEHGMPNKRIEKPGQTAPPLLDKGAVVGQMVAVH